MTAFALTVLVLSAPGFLFQFASDLVSRIRRRRARDLFAAIGELILLSGLLSVAAYLLLDWLFEGSASAAFQTYVVKSIVPHAVWGEFSDAEIMSSAGLFTLFIVGVSMLSGLIFGKLLAWGLVPFRSFYTTVMSTTAGIVQPACQVSVLSKSTVGDAILIYKGLLLDIQLGPENQVEYVAPTEATKSLLYDKTKTRLPHTTKPFEPINAVAGGSPTTAADFLLVEKDDIANLYFEVAPGVGVRRPTAIDSIAYLILRSFSFVSQLFLRLISRLGR